MHFNIIPFVLWAFLFLIGYLIGGTHTGLVFLAGGLAISLIAAFGAAGMRR